MSTWNLHKYALRFAYKYDTRHSEKTILGLLKVKDMFLQSVFSFRLNFNIANVLSVQL